MQPGQRARRLVAGGLQQMARQLVGQRLRRAAAGQFRLQALPPSYYPWLAGILLGYALATTAMKRFYIRRYGWQ